MAVFIIKDKTSYRPNFNVHGSIKKHLVYIVFLRVLQIPSGPLEILSDFALQNILLMQAKCYVNQGQVVAWGCQWEKANENTHKAQRWEYCTRNDIILIIGLPNVPCNWGHVWHSIKSAKFWGVL